MNDADYMKLALDLTKGTLGQTSPNPVVGAVLVKDHQIVGIGVHLKAGEPHAEVHAIKMAGEKAEGATLYVTLEPCSHHGRTPPCSNLVIQTGIKKVFIASTDPNPQVSGRGIQKIKNAGIEVEVGLLQEEAREMNKVFFYNIRTGLPFVTLKTAISLDGKTATVTGESKWITGEEARKDVHQYRHQHDAILVGVNTVIRDNPSLTTRLSNGGKNPIRIILDSQLRTPKEANIINDNLAPTWIVTGNKANPDLVTEFRERGIEVIIMPKEQITIQEMLKGIGEKGITSLFVEGGAEVHGSFLKERAFQQVITYLAPKLLGGKFAPTSFGGEGINKIAEVVSLIIKEVEMVGNDIKIIAEPK